jgi:hypothetical protein
MRRAPQLWEQRLSRTTSILGVGISSSGDATAIVPPQPPPGAGGGTEPAPVAPPVGVFKKPSTPTLIGSVQSINVFWDGLNADGDLWPYDTSFVEVHASTAGTGFTLGTATLRGRLARPGALNVGGLTAGTTYHFRLRGADPAGNYTEASNAASGQTGLTTSSDYGTATIGSGAVSFNARQIGGVTNTVGATAPSSPILNDIWLDSSPGTAIVHRIWNGSSWVANAWGSASIAAGQITALQIAAGAVTAGAISAGAITAEKIQAGAVSADKLTAGTITGFFISGGTVSGGFVTGGTVEGAALQTSGGNSRIRIRNDVAVPFGSSDAIDFFGGGTSKAQVTYNNAVGAFVVYSNDIAFIDYNNAGTARVEVNGSFDVIGTAEAQSFRPTGSVIVFQGYRTTTTAGDVIMRLQSNVTSTGEAKFEVDADGDVKSRTNSYAGFSDARYKDNITPARDYLDDLREVEVVTFNWQGSDQKLLGVTAQQIQPIFPNMVAEDEDGTLSVRYSVFVPMLLTAVQSLADQVDDLRTRIEALEA